MAYFIYILECENGSYYTGYTIDMERRYQEHLDGSIKCKYTRSFPPRRIAACWEVGDLSLALKIEKEIKSLARQQKEALLSSANTLENMLFLKDYPEDQLMTLKRVLLKGA